MADKSAKSGTLAYSLATTAGLILFLSFFFGWKRSVIYEYCVMLHNAVWQLFVCVASCVMVSKRRIFLADLADYRRQNHKHHSLFLEC